MEKKSLHEPSFLDVDILWGPFGFSRIPPREPGSKMVASHGTVELLFKILPRRVGQDLFQALCWVSKGLLRMLKDEEWGRRSLNPFSRWVRDANLKIVNLKHNVTTTSGRGSLRACGTPDPKRRHDRVRSGATTYSQSGKEARSSKAGLHKAARSIAYTLS